MAGANKEKELTRILKGIEDDELDMPSYLRQREVYQPQRTSTGRRA
jgi:hypothetical protein